uniref:Uncharacterized protein n=1 Tax=Romanomermis culicivorax TaxID=13658 RepID=A0A915J9J4_ROMCU
MRKLLKHQYYGKKWYNSSNFNKINDAVDNINNDKLVLEGDIASQKGRKPVNKTTGKKQVQQDKTSDKDDDKED